MDSSTPQPTATTSPHQPPPQPAWATTLPPDQRRPTALPRHVAAPSQPLVPPSLQRVVATLVGIGLAAMAVWFVTAGGLTGGLVAYDSPPQATTGYTVDLNLASRVELVQLPRVGPALADRIIAYRETVGPYRSVDDLLDVPGIGEVTLNSLKPFLRPIAPTRPDSDPDDVRTGQ